MLRKNGKESDKALAKAQDILREYGGQESNIPIDHQYWQLMNQYRGLLKEGK